MARLVCTQARPLWGRTPMGWPASLSSRALGGDEGPRTAAEVGPGRGVARPKRETVDPRLVPDRSRRYAS